MLLVANAAIHLGMDVYGYDPYVSVDAAWKLSRNIHHAKTVDELYKECDYITIHVPAMESTKNMIDKDAHQPDEGKCSRSELLQRCSGQQ